VTELLQRIGPEGSVTGIDPAPAMLAVAAKRAEGHNNVTFHQADAISLPVADNEFDAALSVQVLEYVPGVRAAIAEMHRALQAGGRLVVWDVDRSTVSWRSRDPNRMRRMLGAWDKHLTHVALPQTLAPTLRQAWFRDVEMAAHAFGTIEWDPETYGGALADLIAKYAVEQGGMDIDDAEAWKEEQKQLSAAGEFYFACIQ